MKTSGLAFAAVALARTAFADPSPAPASAAAAPDETIIVIDRAPDLDAAPAARDRDRALDEAPFVTVVHPDDHGATASVADAIGATVGTQTHSLGGLGAFESVTVRGAPPGHTEVLIDGVPLARIAAVTTDLGRFTLDSFDEVELYRGAVPVELGGAGVGGALDMITKLGRGDRGELVTASAGIGSFGARHVRARYGDTFSILDHDWATATTVGYQGATGNYTYFSDNGTPLNPKDDSYQTRTNDQFDQVDVSSRAGLAGTHDGGGVRVAYKDQGLPGSADDPTKEASLATLDLVADAHGDVAVGPLTARELGYVLVEKQRLRDPLGELGLGAQARDYTTLSGGLTSTWIAPFGRHRAVAGVELHADRFTDADADGARPALVGDRETGAALAALDLAVDPGSRIVVTPAVRVDLVRTAPTPTGTGDEGTMPIAVRHDTVASPRVSARAAITSELSAKASAGYYVRLPTLIELFGDRGTIVGAPDLLPERGPSAEAGAVWAPARAPLEDRAAGGSSPIAIDRVMVEADGFATRSHNTIALVPTAGFAVRAMNIADAETYGAELTATARLARIVTLTANYTRLITAQLVPDPSFDDKALPREPGHVIYARADAGYTLFARRIGGWFDASWQSTAYLDQANLQAVPARLLLGCGARIEVVRDLGVSLAVANLANVRVEELPLVPPPRPDLTEAPTALADLQGYPLPGRSFYVSVDWSYR